MEERRMGGGEVDRVGTAGFPTSRAVQKEVELTASFNEASPLELLGDIA